MESLSDSRKISIDHRRTHQITHPELCVLAVELVSSFVQRLAVSLLIRIEEDQMSLLIYSEYTYIYILTLHLGFPFLTK